MDLVILIFLIFRIVKYAKSKGLNPYKWGMLLFLNWFMFALLGVSLATSMLDINLDLDFMYANPGYALLLSLFGIGCGFLGYFMTKKMMDRSIL